MANRRAMKLFAATMLAGASTASASPAKQAVQATPRSQGASERIDWASYMETSMTPRTLRSGSRAPGNTGGKRSEPKRAERSEQAHSLAIDLAIYDAAPAQEPAIRPYRINWRGYLDMSTVAMIQPLLLANGRAACGNTGGKPMPKSECTDAALERNLTKPASELLAATRAYEHEVAAPVVVPRLLANARPACGNTGGKVDRPDDCTAAETRRALEADKVWLKESDKKNARIKTAYTKLIVATEAAVAADPSLEVRLLSSARPACGNTLSKSKSKCDVSVADADEDKR